jgi:hypothetical protein
MERLRFPRLPSVLALCTLALLFSGAPVRAQDDPVEYRLDAAASELYWRVYSDGTLARLGHNHVIAARDFSGSVQRRAPLALSSISIEIPVAALSVDDPSLRARQGEGFTTQPSTDDIAGTRRNMLGERLLDAESHPVIRLQGSGPQGPQGAQTMRLQITLAGRTVTQDVPVQLQVEDDRLLAQGSFQLTHEQLGLRPFSALLGALRVAQPLDFHYRLVALRQD